MPDKGLPDGWRLARLGDVVDVVIGGTPARDHAEYWARDGNGHPWLSIRDLQTPVVTVTREKISDVGVRESNTKLLPVGTLVVSFKLSIGRVAMLGMPMYTNEAIAGLMIRNGSIDNSFLRHLVGLYDFRRVTDAAIKGATLNKAKLQRLPINLPTPGEQRRIAEVLDSIDAAIEKTEAVISATERLRSALLGELLTRGVPGWHTEWKTVPGIGAIPACWGMVRLGDVLESVVYGTNVLTSDSPEGTPVLGMKHIRDGEVTPEALARGVLPDGERDELLLRRGDILFNRTNSIELVGKVGIVRDAEGEMSFASYLLRLRTLADRADPWWLIAFLNHSTTQTALRRMATKGASQANINPTSLRSLSVPLPSLEEQENICAVTESLRDRQVVEGHLLENLQASNTRVASALLSGSVRVHAPIQPGRKTW